VGALEEIATVQHLGDHELWTEAMALHAEVDKLTHTSVDRYATAAEYARRLEDPQRIRTAQCWGHYGEETKIALNWCAAVAEAEGLKPDTPGWDRRIRELADEMNRESTSGKLEVLGLQALRALGLEDKGWSDWSLSSTVSLAAQQHWLDAPPPYPSKSAGGPFAAAESAARLAGKSGGLKDQPGHPPELAAAAGVPQVDLWSTPAGAAAHGLLAEVEAGTLSAADAIKLLVGVGVPDTTSLHEVQDVRKMLGRLAPRAGRPQ